MLLESACGSQKNQNGMTKQPDVATRHENNGMWVHPFFLLIFLGQLHDGSNFSAVQSLSSSNEQCFSLLLATWLCGKATVGTFLECDLVNQIV